MAIQKTRRVPISALNAIGDNSVIAAVAAVLSPEGRILQPARKLRVVSGVICAGGAGNLNIATGLGGSKTNLSGAIPLAASEKLVIQGVADWELAPMETKAGEDLNLFTSAAMALNGWLVVLEVA